MTDRSSSVLSPLVEAIRQLIEKWQRPAIANADSADEAAYYDGRDAGCRSCADELDHVLAEAERRLRDEPEPCEKCGDTGYVHDGDGMEDNCDCGALDRIRGAAVRRLTAPEQELDDDDWREIEVAVMRAPTFAAHTRAEQSRLINKIRRQRAALRRPGSLSPERT